MISSLDFISNTDKQIITEDDSRSYHPIKLYNNKSIQHLEESNTIEQSQKKKKKKKKDIGYVTQFAADRKE